MSNLSQQFSGVSAKRLSTVETQRHASNQHEFNGTVEMRQYLGKSRAVYPARFLYLGSDDEDRLSLEDEITWYDARERHPSRTEHRLYFRDNEVIEKASEGDVLITALNHDGRMLLLIVNQGSSELDEVLWLFGIPELTGTRFSTVNPLSVDQPSAAIFSFVAEEAGLNFEKPSSDDWLDLVLSRFGARFPKTRELSALALETLQDNISPIDDPDTALMALIDREEALFRQLERHIVSQHLHAHATSWEQDVDSFIQFSLGVHNRRKSRAGHALENHLEWIFTMNRLEFDRGALTEGKSKPDFLFPGVSSYLNDRWPSNRLTMLGVKTTCKDRWRQVLNEAHRIQDKHLLTLQPRISEHQTEEMKSAKLSLVLPKAVHPSYTRRQQDWLMDVASFVQFVRERQ